jgi:hypothetical protein
MHQRLWLLMRISSAPAEKEDLRRRSSSVSSTIPLYASTGCDRIDGAHIRASAAIDAYIRVDPVLFARVRDCIGGTLRGARATGNAFIRNFISHFVPPNLFF